MALATRLRLLARSLSAEEYCIIGINPGVASTATAFILDSRNPGAVKNMTISQGSLKESAKRFERVTARMKRNARPIPIHQIKEDDLPGIVTTIYPLGTHIVPLKALSLAFGATRQQQQESWQSLQSPIDDLVVSDIEVQRSLRALYGSASYKIKTRT